MTSWLHPMPVEHALERLIELDTGLGIVSFPRTWWFTTMCGPAIA